MPGWGEILNEIQAEAESNGGSVNIDRIRLNYIQRVRELTGRNVVVYSSDMFTSGGPQTQINLADMQGLMEVFRGLTGPNLDLILHSPGGQAEATDSLVKYMRSKFKHVRIFVPMAAMSAATMWACAGDEIVMGKHSQLGPIDPQFILGSGIAIPAGALIEQFDEASELLAEHPERIAAWLPTLQQYPPGVLNICQSAAELARTLVGEWLYTYMLHADPNGQAKAIEIAEWLSNDKAHLSHSRALTRDQLREHGMKITDLEADPNLQDAVLSVHHAAMHTFGMSTAIKVIENHNGSRWMQHGGQQLVMAQPPTPQPSGSLSAIHRLG